MHTYSISPLTARTEEEGRSLITRHDVINSIPTARRNDETSSPMDMFVQFVQYIVIVRSIKILKNIMTTGA